MNSNVVSAECNHGVCSACAYEDCACICHQRANHERDEDAREEARSAAIEAYWQVKQGDDYGSY